MSSITKGRTEPCNDNIGGILNVYLFDFVNYRNFQIVTSENTLVTYPATTVFKYELRADGNSFNSDLQESDEGNSYLQSVSLILKVLRTNHYEVTSLINKRIGCIIESRLGHFYIMGLRNGCVVKSINAQTGGARTDFNGYNIDLEGKEVNDLFYIDDLSSTGFTIGGGETFFILQENGDFILQENGDKIIQE